MRDPMDILMFQHNPWTEYEPVNGRDEDEEQDPVKELEELDEPEETEDQKPEGGGSIRADKSRYSSVIAEYVHRQLGDQVTFNLEALEVITKEEIIK